MCLEMRNFQRLDQSVDALILDWLDNPFFIGS
jgi:hypothetical protein